MSNPLRFSMDFGQMNSSARPVEGQPLRILVMLDLGAGTRSQDVPLEMRPILPLDVDTFEDLFERERPVISLGEVEIAPREVEDFHPDEIARNLPAFQKLNDLRRRLRMSGSFDAAAAEVRALLLAAPEAGESETVPETDSDTFARLLGKPADAGAAPATPQESFLTGLIREAVAAHIVPEEDPRADHYVAAVDAALAAQMRGVLHDPGFQALEAAWRGLDFLVSRVETDEELSLHLWNVTRDELLAALGEGTLEGSVLDRRLVVEREAAPFTLIVSEFPFGGEMEDMRLLGTLGAIAGRTGGVVLAPVEPDALGMESWAALSDTIGQEIAPSVGWTALRESGVASRICGFGPGFLLRSPYGKKFDPVEGFAFEELERPGEEPEAMLWGAPSVMGAVLIAQAYRQAGWKARLSGNLDFGDLPLVYYEAIEGTRLLPCAEVLLPERAVERVQSAGVVPLVANRSQNLVRLPGVQTISGEGEHVGPFGG
ncbi:type VI secretion system contractile sheath large subunit [Tropicimonas sp. TH_r6]|uniref:type VI secretion system contractile sheath domain-containing protein n=1 Tax=Tropicimonas sp. TH_r6 TaxID=3082085 RepID=UPI002952E7DB|nr:type VI secretion system contractile sheath large subunit [Tropicimonas sp. TH_r6]MDV7142134.1 type VI secretion system contractile sheath large subunit [Tropicimonas sp. TH_r6]